MPKVFTGKVIIPGDKIDEYIAALKKAEEERKPFWEFMANLNEEFYQHLLAEYSPKTARKHNGVVSLFIEFICKYTDVTAIEGITRGMVNTHFQSWWRRKVWDSTTQNEIRVALKKFFTFLASEKGIVNEKVLKTLT